MDWKAVDSTDSPEVTEVIELLDVSFPVPREYIEGEIHKTLAYPEKEGRLHRLRSVDGSLIATAIYGQQYGEGWNGEMMVRFFAVHPDHRRQGHAARIIKEIMDSAIACGAPCVCLSILQSDTVAAGIWKRRGFTIYATQPCKEYSENGLHDCYVHWLNE